MKSNWKKRLLAGTVSLVMTASMVPALGAGSMALADSVVQSSVPTAGTWDVDSLTLQPGETTASINLNWYAPEGTTSALVWFGGQTVEANVRSLIASMEENSKDLLDLCIDVIYHNNMKAFGLHQLILLYIQWERDKEAREDSEE